MAATIEYGLERAVLETRAVGKAEDTLAYELAGNPKNL